METTWHLVIPVAGIKANVCKGVNNPNELLKYISYRSTRTMSYGSALASAVSVRRVLISMRRARNPLAAYLRRIVNPRRICPLARHPPSQDAVQVQKDYS